ncbi:MAG TPA: hypothetical protein VM283_07570, partial [Armatimonadota bacterium]|nr:hypothetical protein [Armatimonadota bacterium]
KMKMAAEPYAYLKRVDVDTTQLDELLTKAREALATGDYATAEGLVDQSISMMQELLKQNPPPEQDQRQEGANPQADQSPGAQTPPSGEGTTQPATGEPQ